MARKKAKAAGTGKATLVALLTRAKVVETLASRLWDAIEILTSMGAVTGGDLQAKFLQDGAGTLSYSGLSTFTWPGGHDRLARAEGG